jgi:hypothetical protein
MNRMTSGAVKAAGALVLAVGLAAASALPAAGSTPTNLSYAVNAAGRFSVQTLVGEASYANGSPVILPNADAAGLLSTGIITDAAGPTGASAMMPALRVALPSRAALRATAISSKCTFNSKTGVVSGSARFVGARIVRAGRRMIRLPADPAANTRIVVPNVAVIILNRQFSGGGGTLTTEALHLRMLRGRQKLILATSVCVAANLAPAPAMGGRVMRLTLGGLGLLLLGGVAYQLSKRRKVAAA